MSDGTSGSNLSEPSEAIPQAPLCGSKMNPLEEAARQMVCHENDVTNHRIGWLLGLEGLLFAALGFAWDKPDGTWLIWIFSGLGAFVAVSVWHVLRASQRALHRLKKWWEDFPDKTACSPGIVGYWYEPGKFKAIYNLVLPWNALPALFVIAWGGVAIANYARVAPDAISTNETNISGSLTISTDGSNPQNVPSLEIDNSDQLREPGPATSPITPVPSNRQLLPQQAPEAAGPLRAPDPSHGPDDDG